jgi:hypothetical protein
MSSTLKGMLAGFVATLVLTGLMVLNSSFGLMPQVDLIRLLRALGTLSTPAAWMDHFIVGVLVWGLLFAGFDAVVTRPPVWLKGMMFGVIAWLIMMVAFLPLAGAGFFGAKLDIGTLAGLLALHLVYGLVLGVVFERLGAWVPVKAKVEASQEEVVVASAYAAAIASGDFNDHLESTSPSGRTVLIALGCLVGFLTLVVLIVEFRNVLGL